MSEQVDSGIDAIGPVHWGTHFCQFYDTAADLADTLVPYFKAGLDGEEDCMWVTAPPFRAADATDALRNAVPDLDARMRRGEIEIIDHDDWYRRADKQGADEVIAGWMRRKDRALARGRRGFRLTGNTYFLEARDWDSFAEYEQRVNRCFCDTRVIALCSYCTLRCDAGAAMDVVQNHEFALARRRGAWTMIESAGVTLAKAELARANAALEVRVEERTAALSHALAEKDVLLREVHHRVKNNLQIVTSLLAMKARGSDDPALRGAFDDTLRRVLAMSLVHEMLYQHEDSSDIDFGAYLERLTRATAESFGVADRIALRVVAATGRVSLTQAVPLGLVAAEALANACKHGFPEGRRGRVAVTFHAPEAGRPGVLEVRDDGVGPGAPGPGSPRPGAGRGAGLRLGHAIARQVGGSLTVAPGPEGGGTVLRLDFAG
jgi:two-component sensor histidine kinase